jgi:L-fuconolactonase
VACGRRRLASFENVSCKLSGLATEAASGWTSADVRPYLEHALDVFGPARCMIGSDWPVLTLAGTMEQWFDAVCDALTGGDRDAVLCGTASVVYGIEV